MINNLSHVLVNSFASHKCKLCFSNKLCSYMKRGGGGGGGPMLPDTLALFHIFFYTRSLS
jgi:hypothetical protein